MSTTVSRVQAAYARIEAVNRPEIWIDLRPQAEVEREARTLDDRLTAGEQLPLAGRLFAAKGNIDVHGLPTTAGCPAYAYSPEADAPVVARLREAKRDRARHHEPRPVRHGPGRHPLPYGAVRNAHDPERISGGSSAGSAVAVALGIVDFALGTDTAGSGRVPAAFNGIVGLKPTRGLVPTAGVVPACASIDCVTVFARTLPEAEQALTFMTSPPTRALPPLAQRTPGPWRIAVPRETSWASWTRAGQRPTRNQSPASAQGAARSAPWTSPPSPRRRRCSTRERSSPSATQRWGRSSTRRSPPAPRAWTPQSPKIITRARDIPAHQLYADEERLAALRTRALSELADADALLLPTTRATPP